MNYLLPDDQLEFDEPEVNETFSRGMGYKRKCQYDDAVREFNAVIKMAPDLSIAHYELAKSYLLKGDNPGALREFERAARFEPDNMDVRFFLRYVPRFTKPLSEELKDVQKAVDINAGDAGAHNLLGVILMMIDSRDCGMQEIQWAVELSPDNAEYHLNLAYARSLVDEGEAVGEAKEALRLEPEWLDAFLFLGALYMDLDQVVDAFDTYKDAVELFPNNGLIHYLLGNVYFAANNIVMARIEMETALELDPDNYEARRALAELYVISGWDDKAIEQLEVLVEMEPGVKKVLGKLEGLKANR